MAAPLSRLEVPEQPLEDGGRRDASRAHIARGILDGMRVIPLHARRLNDHLRGVPALAKAQDGVTATWARLVEAFCQTIEPLLERRFPDLRLVAVADAAGNLVLHRVARDGATNLGAFDATTPEALAALASTRWSAVELRLPSTQVLERKLTLPATSREYLAPIIEHRLDRLTPWRPDRVLYGFRTEAAVGDGAQTGSVAITLTATSRDLVGAPLQRLGAAGLVPTAIGADAGAPCLPLPVNLLGGGAATPPRTESRRFVSQVALAVGGVAVLAFVVTAVLAGHAASDQDVATQGLTKARRLLRSASFANVGSREQAMLENKQPARSTVVLINTLSSSIPPDTYLKELEIHPDRLRLVGSSGNAPALIGKLEAAGLNNVRFTSTLTRDRAGRDDFELGADRPQLKAEDAP